MQESGPIPGHLLQGLDYVVYLLVVDGLGSAFFGHLQTVVEAVDGNHALGAEHESAADRELADRAAAPDGDRVARLDVAVLRAHVSGRENVGQEEHLLVGNPGRDLQRAHVGKRHARVLRLSAGVAAHHVGVAKQTGGR